MRITTKSAVIAASLLLCAGLSWGQEATSESGPGESEVPEVFLSAEIGVIVFPSKGQAPEQQAADETECYEWARRHTAIDPAGLLVEIDEIEQETDVARKEAGKTGKGKEGSSALVGAMVGALIAEVRDDDWEEGAAWGAAVGARDGRREKDRERAAARQQVENEAQDATRDLEAELEKFHMAFGLCLEAKEYAVKY